MDEERLKHLWTSSVILPYKCESSLKDLNALRCHYRLTCLPSGQHKIANLPSVNFGAESMCRRCHSSWVDGLYTLEIKKFTQQKKLRNLVKKQAKKNNLSAFEEKLLKYAQSGYDGYIVQTCNVCGFRNKYKYKTQTEENPPMQSKEEDTPSVAEKKKKKKKKSDKFAGLNASIVEEIKSKKSISLDEGNRSLNELFSSVTQSPTPATLPSKSSPLTTLTLSSEKLKNLDELAGLNSSKREGAEEAKSKKSILLDKERSSLVQTSELSSYETPSLSSPLTLSSGKSKNLDELADLNAFKVEKVKSKKIISLDKESLAQIADLSSSATPSHIPSTPPSLSSSLTLSSGKSKKRKKKSKPNLHESGMKKKSILSEFLEGL